MQRRRNTQARVSSIQERKESEEQEITGDVSKRNAKELDYVYASTISVAHLGRRITCENGIGESTKMDN